MSIGQSCPHSADSSRERGRSGQTPWSAPASLQFVFHLRGKTCAGCEHTHPHAAPAAARSLPCPAARHTHPIPAYTNPPRAKHWPRASAPRHAASPSPALLPVPARCWHCRDLPLTKHPAMALPCQVGSGGGGGGGGMATLWGPSGLIPKAQTGTGTGWPGKGTGCSGRGHSRVHQPLGCSANPARVCCCAVQLPGPLCLCTLLGLPWHPEGAGAVCLSQSCLVTLSL